MNTEKEIKEKVREEYRKVAHKFFYNEAFEKHDEFYEGMMGAFGEMLLYLGDSQTDLEKLEEEEKEKAYNEVSELREKYGRKR